MSYFRPEIDALLGYVPGEQPQVGKFIKLNTNENPYPPSPAVARAITATLERGLARYPDPLASGFCQR
ncbi:MAG TPA: histidinol-phosphate transaminase, partial [Pirellulales bacterium]